MTAIDFNSENYGHRLLLAQAMRDYARAPGHTLTGADSSLLGALADAGIAMSKSNLDRIAAAGHPDDRSRPYGNNARRVAQFLGEKGFFPPGQKPDEVFKLLPLFFGGFSEGGAALLRELEGTYYSYQYSEFTTEVVTIGELTIGPLTPWNFATFKEHIGNIHMRKDMMMCDGVVFTDDQKNVYMIGREYFRQYPRYYMLEGIDRPDGGEISILSGTLLSAGLHARRHLTPIALRRTEEKGQFVPQEGGLLTELPEYVGHYLSMTLAAGPRNKAPGMSLAEIDERTKSILDQRSQRNIADNLASMERLKRT